MKISCMCTFKEIREREQRLKLVLHGVKEPANREQKRLNLVLHGVKETSQQCRREQEVSGRRQKYLCEDIQNKGQNGKGRHQILQES